MRRSTFYMGQCFTQRHLARVRSPLMSGYISSQHSSATQSTLNNSALTSGCTSLTVLASAGWNVVGVPQELAQQLQCMSMQMQQTMLELAGLHSIVTFILARACYILLLQREVATTH